MKPLSVKLSPSLDAELRARARRSGKSLGTMVREAVEQYMAAETKPRKGSVADLARDLIGVVEGPGDLSTNPKHMRGYGR